MASRRLRDVHPRRAIVLLALAAGALRLAFLGIPLSSDEGGYLVAASQWSAGTSTYGDHFVDRPPLLMAVFALADALGGTWPLRVIGVLVVGVSVLLAGRLGGVAAAATAAVLLSMPLFDPLPVNGELLSVPFVLAGILALVHAERAASRGRRYWATAWATALAGLLAACAFLVKQNVVDVGVVAAALLLAQARRGGWRDAGVRVAVFACAALVTLALAVWGASLRGTSPSDLWDAVVLFRMDAASWLRALGDPSADYRRMVLLLVLLASAVPLVVAACLREARRTRPTPYLVPAALALLCWEVLGFLVGGGYWRHYLIALVPGVVLLVASVRANRVLWVGLALATLSAVIQLPLVPLHPPRDVVDAEVVAFLREHSDPGDTLVVGFGHANILRSSGLESPYEHLWVLPTQVRDTDLAELTSVLAGDEAPRWLVVDGDSLDDKGLEHDAAQAVLEERYTPVAQVVRWRIFELTDD